MTLVQAFLNKSDVKKQGGLDKVAFVNYLTQHEKELHFVFTTIDENKDGKEELALRMFQYEADLFVL